MLEEKCVIIGAPKFNTKSDQNRCQQQKLTKNDQKSQIIKNDKIKKSRKTEKVIKCRKSKSSKSDKIKIMKK